MTMSSQQTAMKRFDDLQKYVRVTGVRDNHFTEFEFSIGDPNLYVELILPFEEFQNFCERHNARSLTVAEEAEVDFEKLKWRNGTPGQED